MRRFALLALVFALPAAGVAAGPVQAADACPPGWHWEAAKPNYTCRIDLGGLTPTEAEARRAVTLYQDLAAIAYDNCGSGVSAPAGNAAVTAEGSGFRWHLAYAFSCKLPT